MIYCELYLFAKTWTKCRLFGCKFGIFWAFTTRTLTKLWLGLNVIFPCSILLADKRFQLTILQSIPNFANELSFISGRESHRTLVFVLTTFQNGASDMFQFLDGARAVVCCCGPLVSRQIAFSTSFQALCSDSCRLKHNYSTKQTRHFHFVIGRGNTSATLPRLNRFPIFYTHGYLSATSLLMSSINEGKYKIQTSFC